MSRSKNKRYYAEIQQTKGVFKLNLSKHPVYKYNEGKEFRFTSWKQNSKSINSSFIQKLLQNNMIWNADEILLNKTQNSIPVRFKVFWQKEKVYKNVKEGKESKNANTITHMENTYYENKHNFGANQTSEIQEIDNDFIRNFIRRHGKEVSEYRYIIHKDKIWAKDEFLELFTYLRTVNHQDDITLNGVTLAPTQSMECLLEVDLSVTRGSGIIPPPFNFMTAPMRNSTMRLFDQKYITYVNRSSNSMLPYGCFYNILENIFYKYNQDQRKNNKPPLFDSYCDLYQFFHGKDAEVPLLHYSTKWELSLEQFLTFTDHHEIPVFVYNWEDKRLLHQTNHETKRGRIGKFVKRIELLIGGKNHVEFVDRRYCHAPIKELTFDKPLFPYYDLSVQNFDKDVADTVIIEYKMKRNYYKEYLDIPDSDHKKQVSLLHEKHKEFYNILYKHIFEDGKEENIYCYQYNMFQVLSMFLNNPEQSIVPQVNCSYNKINSIKLYRINDETKERKKFTIRNLNDNVFEKNQTDLPRVDDLILSLEKQVEIKKIFLHPAVESFYNPNVMNLFLDACHIGPLNQGYKKTLKDVKYMEFDFSKCYTNILYNLPFIPIMHVVHDIEDFDGELKDHYLYLCETTNPDHHVYPFGVYEYRCKPRLCYGLNLKNTQYKILKQIPTIRYETSQYKNYIDLLYSDESVPEKIKKNLVNVVIGMMGKKCVCESVGGNYFLDEQRAYDHKRVLDKNHLNRGGVNVVKNKVDTSKISISTFYKLNLSYEFDRVLDLKLQDIYLVGKMKRDFLKSGFYPLYLLILDCCRKEMSVLKEQCEQENIEVYGIRTDCLFVSPVTENVFDKFVEKYNYSQENKKFGYLKKPSTFDISELPSTKFKSEYPKTTFEFEHDSVMEELSYQMYEKEAYYTMKNEYDVDEMVELIKNNKSIFINGPAGFGKTYLSLLAIKKLNLKFCVITPDNIKKFLQEKEGRASKTFHNFTGVRYNQSIPPITNGSVKRRFTDENQFDIFLLDEFFMFDVECINQFIRSLHNSNAKVIATGDPYQLKKNRMHEVFGDRAIDLPLYIFDYCIELQVLKRMDLEKDRILYSEFFTYVKEKNLNAMKQWCHQNLNIVKFDQIPTNVTRAITHRNDAQFLIDNKLHPYHRSSQLMWNVTQFLKVEEESNYKTRLEEWNESKDSYENEKEWKQHRPKVGKIEIKRFQVFDVEEKDDDMVVFTDSINKLFSFSILKKDKEKYMREDRIKLPYSYSCHASQGQTISEPLLIHGINDFFYSKQQQIDWLYTAVSRASQFSNIYLLIDDAFDKKIKDKKPKKYEMQVRIKQHKQEDLQAKRITPEKLEKTKTYIDEEWIKNNWVHSCPHCETPIDKENYSIDRLNNKNIHTKTNCLIVCRSCNNASKNRM